MGNVSVVSVGRPSNTFITTSVVCVIASAVATISKGISMAGIGNGEDIVSVELVPGVTNCGSNSTRMPSGMFAIASDTGVVKFKIGSI